MTTMLEALLRRARDEGRPYEHVVKEAVPALLDTLKRQSEQWIGEPAVPFRPELQSFSQAMREIHELIGWMGVVREKIDLASSEPQGGVH